MNYEILIGKTVNINDTILTVNTIKPVKQGFITQYCINDGPSFSKLDIATCINEVESEIENSKPIETGPFSFITKKFGLFYSVRVLPKDVLSHTEQSILVQFDIGLREYGYNKVGFFGRFRLGRFMTWIEFSWNEKRLYNKGVLPESLTEFKKIF